MAILPKPSHLPLRGGEESILQREISPFPPEKRMEIPEHRQESDQQYRETAERGPSSSGFSFGIETINATKEEERSMRGTEKANPKPTKHEIRRWNSKVRTRRGAYGDCAVLGRRDGICNHGKIRVPPARTALSPYEITKTSSTL
ncbi:hypothetical protein BHE74_00023765 [Ensete ventricosum]|nr:hypothetical protein BHE74_00023765 [Ensete ventricosum]